LSSPSDATAVLLATTPAADGGAAALLPFQDGTVVGRLASQLAALGVREAHVVARPGHADAVAAALDGIGLRAQVHPSGGGAEDVRLLGRLAAAAADRPLVVLPGNAVAHAAALARLVADGRDGTAILAGAPGAPAAHPIRSHRARVVSAGSGHHGVGRPTESFLGLLKVGAADRAAAAAAAERLAALAARRGSDDADDAAALLLVGLVRSGTPVSATALRELYWTRPDSAAAAARAAGELAVRDEDRALLDSAVKASDGFFTTFLVSPYSRHVARWAARRGLTPNQVTSASMLLGVLAAAGFATGERWGLVAGAVLLQLAFTADCVDGQLARYTRRFSAFGGWLDSMFDRGKEYVVFGGLAIGASRTGDPVWLLACCALTLQTVRHMADFAYGAVEHRTALSAPRPPLAEPSDGVAGGGTGAAGRALGRWQALNRTPALLWLKKMLAFPIGERFAVVSITAALLDARATFVALLAWGAVAAAYSFSGRVLRSVAR
jgi:phosphatidylglycerophosphate synthase